MRLPDQSLFLPRTSPGLWLGVALAAAACFASSAVEYPLRWRWSNPRPHGGNIVDVAYSPGLGLAVEVAELGQIFSSADLNLWISRDSGTTNDLRAVTFLGGRILVTGSSGTVLYADDPATFHAGVLISGPTADWLEAATASPVLAVAVGDNGAVYSSTNGIYWKRQASGTVQWLRGVAWGAGAFVAVGENGRIISSANGTNWVLRTSGATQHFNRVTYANSRFTAVAENGDCRYSTNNGVNWMQETTGATNDLFGAATATGLRLIVGDHEVRSQLPGGPWQDELAQPDTVLTPWTYYVATRPPEFFLAAGRTGVMDEGHPGTNVTGLHWAHGDESLRNWLWDVTWPSGLYVAVGDRATVMTSVNGVDWKLEAVPDAVTNAVFLGVGGTTNMLVAAGSGGSLIISPNVVGSSLATNLVGTNLVVTNVPASSFGVIWFPARSGSTNDLEGVAGSEKLLVVTGAHGTILTSPDGTNWTPRPAPTGKFLSSVTAWPGGWIATGDDGAIVSSPDGKAWTFVPMPTTNWLYRVRYLGGKLIVVGQNGSIYTSSDGAAWTRQSCGTIQWLNDVAWLDGTWFVVGNAGTVLVSTNAINWTSVGTVTRKNLYGAATDSMQLVSIGLEGVILRSQIVADPTPVQILSFDRVSTNMLGGVVTENLYLFGGRPDQQFTLDYLPSLETNAWITGPALEFIDGSGTLFYLETILSSNPPPREFYRTTLRLP